MAGAESHVRVPADSTGKKMRTVKELIGADEVHNEGVVVADPTTTSQMLAVDAAGKIGISASALPTGAATEATLATVDADTGAIKTAVETLDNAIAGNEMQVDVVAALPAGANAIGKLAANTGVDIGDVDVTSVVPLTGATNLGKAEDAAHANGDTGVATLGVRADSPTSRTNVDGDYINLITDEYGRLKILTLHDQTPYDHAFFNAAADGALVAAVGGKVIKVHAITIQAAGTVVVNIRTNNAAGTILDSWTLQAREGVVKPFAPYPAHWFQTAVGEALYVDVTAAVNVTINCVYTDDDAA